MEVTPHASSSSHFPRVIEPNTFSQELEIKVFDLLSGESPYNRIVDKRISYSGDIQESSANNSKGSKTFSQKYVGMPQSDGD